MKGLKRMEKDDREMEEMKSGATQEEGGGGGVGQPSMSRDPVLLQLTAGGSQAGKRTCQHARKSLCMRAHTHTHATA